MKKSIAGFALVLFTSLAWALPTVQQVEAEVKQGRFTQAETMMAEVVAAKPQSAKAHYLYAELLAHNANFTKASEQAALAKSLDPKIGFTDPARFEAFQKTLQRELDPVPRERTTSVPAPARVAAERVAQAPPASSGIPGWVWFGGLMLIGMALWTGLRRSRAALTPGLAPAGGAPGFGPGSGMNQGAYPGQPYGPGAYPPQQRSGSGLLGTGLAVAGGVAGGMLIDEMLHRRNDGGASSGNQIGGFDPNSYQPSSADQAASELESRPIDFGSGGDWDSGGGSSDSGDSGGGGWD